MEKIEHDYKLIFEKRTGLYIVLFKDYYDDEEYSVLSFGKTELEAYKMAFEKVIKVQEKCINKLADISNLMSKEFPDNLDGCMINSSYFETCPENPCHSGDTRTETKCDALYFNENNQEWGYLIR